MTTDLPQRSARAREWWRDAVVYQVYLRSFADGDGDGEGDIAGLRSRLPYISELGVDAIWINPWYPSPMVDGGYDVADHRDVAPRFGTLADAEALVAAAHDLGLRVLLDIVPNHTSDQHPWFRAAVAAGPGSPERERYLFRPGHGRDGDEPPNDWQSVFGGPAWTRVTEADGSPGEWYVHLFAPEQPDVNWSSPHVQADFERTLRFWFDRGVDGFRIDVAHSLVKHADLPDLGDGHTTHETGSDGTHPHWDREDVHDIYRSWRAIADSYDPPRVFVAEAWVDHPERLARYVRPDELHTAFTFDLLEARWQAPALRAAIDATRAEQETVGAPPVWVLSNHDVARHLSRYARDQEQVTGHDLDQLLGTTADLELGLRRARAAILLLLALPGSVYLYQGEELGLPEVEDLPEACLDDPTWRRSGHTQRGRDGCRVPLPWSGDTPPFGFGPAAARPWLPQPADWGDRTVAAREADPDSILHLYRRALALRRATPALRDGELRWLEDASDDVLAFVREPGVVCLVNLGAAPVPVPAGARVLVRSAADARGDLPPDSAVWVSTAK